MANTQIPQPPPPPLNVAALMKQAAAARPHQRAVVVPTGRDKTGRIAYTHLTLAQLDRDSDRLAAAFDTIGINRGTRTVVMLRPGLEFMSVSFALFKCGAVPVMVDPGMGLGRMIRCLEESRPKAFVGIPIAHLVRMVFPKYFKTVQHCVTVGWRVPGAGPTLAHLLKSAWRPYPLARTHRDDMAAILFTTGSTGPAKGVVYTHGTFAAQIQHIRTAFGIQPGEIDLPTFPLFALFDPALGMTAVIPDMDPTRPASVNPQRIIEAVENQGVTNMFASPALLHRVGGYGKRHGIRLPSLKRVVSAGAPVSPANISQFSAMLTEGAEILTPYGATECVPITSIGSREILSPATVQKSEQGFGNCVGRALDGIRVEIITLTDAPIATWDDSLLLPPGDIGEIAAQGDVVTREYFRRPRHDALAKIRDPRGIWHRMGDLGWKDKIGRIWFCGRKSHRIVTETETLFTIPCEAVFNGHPQVHRSALVGIGPRGHQLPVICIEPVNYREAKRNEGALRDALLALADAHVHTRPIRIMLLCKTFPVDIRHNAKIFREKLAVWAARKLGPDPGGRPATPVSAPAPDPTATGQRHAHRNDA